jgi:hypothetical protein
MVCFGLQWQFFKENKMFADKYELETWAGPSMATIRSRQLAAFGRGCKCGKLRDPVSKSSGSRSWMSCLRCLGTIKTLTKKVKLAYN